MRTLIALAALAAGVAAIGEDGVLALDDSTFYEHVGKDVPALVEFYAPWCGHCKNLAPEYAKVAETFASAKGSVLVAKVDADSQRDLGSKFDIKGFPTLKWFPAGSLTPEDYEGPRDAEGIVAFINGKTGLSKKVKTAPSAVLALTPENFDAVVADPSKGKLLEFYAPWCGHCKALAPTYEKLATVFEGDADKVVIAKIDADKHRELGDRFGVTGFPTLKWIPAGHTGKVDEAAQAYEGGRDLPAFVDFINKNAGTARKADGGLLPTAGRLAEFDALAAAFAAAPSADALEAAKAAAGKAAAGDAKRADAYVKVMAKILEKGAGYAAKEAARLDGMLAAEGVAKAKKTELALKRNVLAAFLAEKKDAEAEL